MAALCCSGGRGSSLVGLQCFDNFANCWKRVLIVNFCQVFGLDEVSQSSTPFQTVDHFLTPVTSKDCSKTIPELVAEAVGAACRQRLLGHGRCSVGSRLVDMAAKEKVRRRHECPECGDVLASSTVLRRHQLVHSGRQPWSCGYCAARFSLKFNCSRHCRSKHPGLPSLVAPTPVE